MTITDVLLLIATGVAVGWINNLAGAAGALGLIAFQALLHMDVMAANANLRPSALAIGCAGLLGFLSKGRSFPPRVWLYALLTVPGAVLGSLLVRPRFTLLFQLVLAALLLVVLIQQVRNRSGRMERPTDRRSPPWLLLLLFTWLGAHMGFVQVATGLVAIFVLSIVHSRDLVEVNAAKMALVIVSAVTSNITLAAGASIDWPPALALAGGAGIGSFLASRWSVRKGHGSVRLVVIVICVVVLVHLGFDVFGRR